MKRKTRLIRPRAAKTPVEIDRIGQLESRIADLEGRIARLEGTPFEQGWPQGWPRPRLPDHEEIPPHDPVGGGVTCSLCGMLWRGVMGYCCPRSNCPMGAGPVMCRSTTDTTYAGEQVLSTHAPQYTVTAKGPA